MLSQIVHTIRMRRKSTVRISHSANPEDFQRIAYPGQGQTGAYNKNQGILGRSIHLMPNFRCGGLELTADPCHPSRFIVLTISLQLDMREIFKNGLHWRRKSLKLANNRSF